MMRIHSLDGLRAIAASLVVVAHLAKQHHASGFTYCGPVGVHLFFVMSGFLITTLLLQEERRLGKVSLGKFWMRRALRIVPAYLGYVLTVVLVARVGSGMSISDTSILGALTFTTGWLDGDWELGHLWSLAVETQFYVVWPLVVLLGNARTRWIVALLVLVGGMLGRVCVYRWLGPSRMLASVCNLDSIIVGCLLGMLLGSMAQWVRETWGKIRMTALPGAVVGVGVMLWLASVQRLGILTVPLGNTILALGIALFVLDTVLQEHGLVHRVLNSPGVVWIGTLSYSIYLWQQFVLRPDGIAELFGAGPWPDQPTCSISLVLLLAAASYYGLERPLLSLRQRCH